METRTATVDKNVVASTGANVSGVTRNKDGCIWAIAALGVILGMFVFGFIVGRGEGQREKVKEYENQLGQWSKAYEQQREYTKEYKRLLENELRKR